MIYRYVDSPLGQLMLAGEDGQLQVVGFPEGSQARRAEPDWEHDDACFADVKRQLDDYFKGERRDFELDLAPGGTPFQLSVLAELVKIPYGETCTYRDIATAIGNPKAVRAVGGANGSNPIPIIIPCHRVIGSNGSLTGFGGGLPVKRFLLNLELSRSGLFATGVAD